MNQTVYYCICRGVQNPFMNRISHVIKVYETTLDKIDEIHRREVAPFYSEGIYDLHTLIIDRPADLNFLKLLAQAEREKAK